jgi:hypothetical protein
VTRDRAAYLRAVLTAYVDLPDTPVRPRPPDRALAARLYDRRVPLSTVCDALTLAHARRTLRPPEAPPLPRVRSLYYFLPVIEELLATPLPNMYIDYIRAKLGRLPPVQRPKNRASS